MVLHLETMIRSVHGIVSIYDALRQSFNIPALKASAISSKMLVMMPKFAAKLGLNYEGDIGPSEVLGGSASNSHQHN